MKISLAVILLLGTSAYGRMLDKKKLAQAFGKSRVQLYTSQTQMHNYLLNFDWDTNSQFSDDFSNTVKKTGEKIIFSDKYGMQWSYLGQEDGGQFVGARYASSSDDTPKEQWQYDNTGYTYYENTDLGATWETYPDGSSEFYIESTGETVNTWWEQPDTISQASCPEHPVQVQNYTYFPNNDQTKSSEVLIYNYDHKGSQKWQQLNEEGEYDGSGDMWVWDQPSLTWCYIFGGSGVKSCSSYSQDSTEKVIPEFCLITPLNNQVCYSVPNDEWFFEDAAQNKMYYYPEWAWGTEDDEWYLWDELHDMWVTGSNSADKYQSK